MTTALEGYGVLVTGGGSGIGEGCALALARDGAVVTICGRTADKLDAAAARIRNTVDGAGVHTITADVTDEAQVEAAVAKAAKEAGALHGVVASAGGSLHMGPLVLADVEAVRATLDLNVIGTFLTLKHSAPLLAKTKGSFVGISSHAGLDTFRFLGAYGAAKSGLDHLVRVAADELGPSRVRVNSIRPGIIDNELMSAITQGSPVLDSYLEEIPLGEGRQRRRRRRARPVPRRARVVLHHGPVHQHRRRAVAAEGRRLRRVRRARLQGRPRLGSRVEGCGLMEIEGKVAAITGGASGIGRATALELVRRGATGVVLADLNDERLAETKDAIEALGAKAVTVHCDVSKDADVERYRDEALAAFDDVDIVMNNAGVAMIGPAEGLSMDEWDWILQINLYGVIRGVRAFLPHLLERGSGHVVNTSSVAGLFAYAWDHPAYITAKHGVVGLTESIALYLKPNGDRRVTPVPEPRVHQHGRHRALRRRRRHQHVDARHPARGADRARGGRHARRRRDPRRALPDPHRPGRHPPADRGARRRPGRVGVGTDGAAPGAAQPLPVARAPRDPRRQAVLSDGRRTSAGCA